MTLTRVLRTHATSVAHTFYLAGTETAADSSTTVTVTITDANGTVVAAGDATSAGVGTGRYTFALGGQAELALLTVAWSATISAAAIVETDQVEIVGGFFFTLAEGRASDPVLADTVKYTTADLIAKRLETEIECEEICDRAFVPRYRRAVLDGTGTNELMLVGDNDIRRIRSARIAPRVGQAFVALSAGQLAALAITPDRVVQRTDGAVWTAGRQNIVVEYEYGLDAPPEDLARASKIRFRSRLHITRTGIPERAQSYTTSDGSSYRLTTPDAYETGLADVDAIYGRWSLRSGAGTDAEGRGVPASRTLDYNPQRDSLFHGGRR